MHVYVLSIKRYLINQTMRGSPYINCYYFGICGRETGTDENENHRKKQPHTFYFPS